jgi:predicted regulator of Ras-like GTPase activity (Roadblock/LC7/MglB family)
MSAAIGEELRDEGPLAQPHGASLSGADSQAVSLPIVDVAQALADLQEISSQIEAAVLFRSDGSVEGSTLSDETAAKGLAEAAAALLGAADAVRGDDVAVTQLEAALADGCVFVVRDGDRRIAATTVASPTVGLVFYDLKSCLRDSKPAEPEEKPKRASRKKAAEVEE